MTPRVFGTTLLAATWLAGCQCTSADIVELESDASTGSSSDASTGSAASDVSTGEPFDVSRWIGRYHFENTFLPFGERGDPHGSYSLVNFEILPDSRARMSYDNCYYPDGPITIEYEWLPSVGGWLSLHPGMSETSLRYMALENLETLRVQLVEPCRELRFEIDGKPDGGFFVVRPGESCWVDRCTTPGIMQVGYCEGEEPPPCP